MNVLIIENDESTAIQLTSIAEKEQCDGIIASTSQMAYKFLEETLFHLVLLDINSPNNKGFEILKKIRLTQKFTELPVIILSTIIDDKLVRKSLRLGANDFVQKPFNDVVLQLKIRNFLQTQQVFVQFNQNEREFIKSSGIKNSIINSSIDCIKTLDLEGNLLSLNRGGQELLEIEDVESFYHKSWLKFWRGEDFENAQIAIKKAKEGGIGYFEGYCPTMKGKPKWWGVIISPILDLNGKVHQILSVSRDISLQKVYEHKLQERIKEFYCLQQLSELVERNDEIQDIIKNLILVLQESFQNPEQTGFKISYDEFSFQSKNYELCNLVLTTKIQSNNKMVGLIDIGLTKNSEIEILEEERTLINVVAERLGRIIERLEQKKNYKYLFDTLAEGIIKTNNQGVITEVNVAAANLCGYTSPEELKGTHIKKIYALPETREEILNKLERENDVLNNFEFLLKQQSGQKIWTSCNIRLLRNSNGEYLGTLGAFHDITEVRRAEHEVKKSEEKHKRLVHNTISMILEINADSLEIISCNPAMAKSMNKNVDELIGGNIKRFFSTSDVKKRIETGEKAFRINKVLQFENENNGRYYLNNVIPYKTDNQRFVQTVTFDITDSKIKQALEKSDLALRLANDRYQDAQKIGRVGNWEYNIKTKNFWVSEQIFRIFGFTTGRKKLSVEDIESCIVKHEQERVRKAAVELIEKNRPYHVEYEIITQDEGNKKNILSIAELIKDKRGFPEKVAGVIQDITERKKVEEALRQQHVYLEKLNNSLVNVVFTVRMSDRKISYVNNSIETIFGYSKEDCINNNTSFLYPNEKSYKEFGTKLQTAIKHNKEFLRTEHQLKRKNGEVFPAEITTTFLKEKDSIEEVISIITDITERKKAEEALKNSEVKYRELNASKDKFFSIISHDLKNPFNAILGFSDLALDMIKTKEYDKIYRYCEIINRVTKQGFNLLNNLLQWSQLQTGRINFNPEFINYNAIIESTISLLTANYKEKNIRLLVDLPQEFNVIADHYMIETIVRNLLSNAIKFTHENGIVKLSVKKQEDKILTEVEDNGVGLSKKNIIQLFKIESSFSMPGTNEEKGTGLGLILCKEFIEKHGGEIWVESVLNKGAKFSFSINT